MTSPIDFHPFRKGGLKPNDPSKPRLKLRTVGAVREVPAHPLASEMFTGVLLGMDYNDRFGTCVPTGLDNFIRMVSVLLTGSQESQSIETIVRWYRSQNPNFNPDIPGGVQDEGMVIQDFLAYLVKQGVILGFAEIDVHDDEMLKAANYLAMGPVNGAELAEAQVSWQYEQGVWDVTSSPVVGGHCFVTGAYSAGEREEDCATWAKRVGMTARFLDAQRSEAWAVLLPMHLRHPGFRAAFDLAAWARAYEEITGRPAPFDVEPQPEPAPTPTPGDGWFHLDAATILAVDRWAVRHSVAHEEGPNTLLRRILHVREDK